MFDGVPPERRRRITTREAKTLARLEDAAALAQEAAERATAKWRRYAGRINARCGTSLEPGEIITHWIVQELNNAG